MAAVAEIVGFAGDYYIAQEAQKRKEKIIYGIICAIIIITFLILYIVAFLNTTDDTKWVLGTYLGLSIITMFILIITLNQFDDNLGHPNNGLYWSLIFIGGIFLLFSIIYLAIELATFKIYITIATIIMSLFLFALLGCLIINRYNDYLRKLEKSQSHSLSTTFGSVKNIRRKNK